MGKKKARADALGLDLVYDGQKHRLKTLELTNPEHLDVLQELIDAARDRLPEEPDHDPALVQALRDLGDNYGPLGVALVAAELTNMDVLIEQLGYDVIPNGIPEELKWWKRPICADLPIDLSDDFENQIPR